MKNAVNGDSNKTNRPLKENTTLIRLEKNFYSHLNSGIDALDFFKNTIKGRTWGSFKVISKSLKKLADDLSREGLLTEDELNTIYDEIKAKKINKNPIGMIDIDAMYKFLAKLFKSMDHNINKEGIELLDRNKVTLFLALPFLFHENFKFFEKLTPESIINKIDMPNGLLINWKSGDNIKGVLIKREYELYSKLFTIYLDNTKQGEPIFKEFISKQNQIKVYSKMNTLYKNIISSFLHKEYKDTQVINVITELKNSLKSKSNSLFSPI